MKTINIGLIGYGVVGQGVVKILKDKRGFFKEKFGADFRLKTLCDRSIHKKDARGLAGTKLTKNVWNVLKDPDIQVVIELIGGIHPALDIIKESLKSGKSVITANKAVIAHHGVELFALARQHEADLYLESSVGAGIPIIKSLTEGLAGNKFESLYGIVNGTCNFILSQMTHKSCSFETALKEAQRLGYAESNPALDINGADTAHKLAILAYFTFGKMIPVKEIYTEGISRISHDDIEYAESMDLTIKLLAVAKKNGKEVEARVHPTLISKDHPLAAINGVNNAVVMNSDLMGQILFSGRGAGQEPAASGVISDLVNYATKSRDVRPLCNLKENDASLKVRKIDEVSTKFYIRFMAMDKAGVLSKISGILGGYGIGIHAVTQKGNVGRSQVVPLIILTDTTTEGGLRKALNDIQKLSVIKDKPVAIRIESL